MQKNSTIIIEKGLKNDFLYKSKNVKIKRKIYV